MSTTSDQLELDYAQAAHYRVAADTRLLKKQVSVTLDGAERVLLEDEVIRIEAVNEDTSQVIEVGHVDYMLLKTSSTPPVARHTVFTRIGRYLYFLPTPTTGTILTMIYSYRPAPITSASNFELSGRAETLIARLSLAYSLLDDGQPELGQQELADYLVAANSLRHGSQRSVGWSGTLTVAGGRDLP